MRGKSIGDSGWRAVRRGDCTRGGSCESIQSTSDFIVVLSGSRESPTTPFHNHLFIVFYSQVDDVQQIRRETEAIDKQCYAHVPKLPIHALDLLERES